MKRHETLIPLSREHHDVLILAQLLKSDIPDYAGLPSDPEEKRTLVNEKFEQVMKPHFVIEEKIAEEINGKFPEIDKLSSEIIAEHEQISSSIKALENSSDLPVDLDSLGHLMESHVRKEEREWFRLIQELLGDEYLNKLKSL